MAIQNRRGIYGKFDPSKMLPGEWAVVLSGDPNVSDGKAVYICFSAGDVKQIATVQDMMEIINREITDKKPDLIEDIVNSAVGEVKVILADAEKTIAQVKVATDNANNAATEASTAASLAGVAAQSATQAVEAASRATEAANKAADSAVEAISAANEAATDASSAAIAANEAAERANAAAGGKVIEFCSTEVAVSAVRALF